MSVLKLSSRNFEKEVLKSETTVLVDFYADWCGPCRAVSPIVEKISDENTDLKVCKINVDDDPDLAEKYSVMSIPTLLVFKNGELVRTEVGAKTKSEIINMLQ